MKHPRSQQVQRMLRSIGRYFSEWGLCCSSFRPVSGENEQSDLDLRGGHRKLCVVSRYVSVIDTLNHTWQHSGLTWLECQVDSCVLNQPLFPKNVSYLNVKKTRYGNSVWRWRIKMTLDFLIGCEYFWSFIYNSSIRKDVMVLDAFK